LFAQQQNIIYPQKQAFLSFINTNFDLFLAGAKINRVFHTAFNTSQGLTCHGNALACPGDLYAYKNDDVF
jgi:hypothetical protein